MSSESEHSATTQVSLPTTLIERVKRRLPDSSFTSVEEYIGYVVEQVLDQLETKENSSDEEAFVFSKEDQQDIERRLKDMGYM